VEPRFRRNAGYRLPHFEARIWSAGSGKHSTSSAAPRNQFLTAYQASSRSGLPSSISSSAAILARRSTIATPVPEAQRRATRMVELFIHAPVPADPSGSDRHAGYLFTLEAITADDATHIATAATREPKSMERRIHPPGCLHLRNLCVCASITRHGAPVEICQKILRQCNSCGVQRLLRNFGSITADSAPQIANRAVTDRRPGQRGRVVSKWLASRSCKPVEGPSSAVRDRRDPCHAAPG
jgi:hypothetical protein